MRKAGRIITADTRHTLLKEIHITNATNKVPFVVYNTVIVPACLGWVAEQCYLSFNCSHLLKHPSEKHPVLVKLKPFLWDTNTPSPHHGFLAFLNQQAFRSSFNRKFWIVFLFALNLTSDKTVSKEANRELNIPKRKRILKEAQKQNYVCVLNS